MIYIAIIEHHQTGEHRALKLGRCSGMARACNVARDKAPDGWRVVDVSGRT